MQDKSFLDYDVGYREGVFDKCNGSDAEYPRDEIDSDPFIGGYFDGYDNHQTVIERDVPVSVVMEADKPLRFFKLSLEWDYGQDAFIFDSREAAIRWMDGNIDYSDFNPVFANAEEIFGEGLAGLDIVTLVS